MSYLGFAVVMFFELVGMISFGPIGEILYELVGRIPFGLVGVVFFGII